MKTRRFDWAKLAIKVGKRESFDNEELKCLINEYYFARENHD